MIHTALTIYSAEGVAVLVIVYTLGIAFIVSYYKWCRAAAELKRLRHSLEDDLKTRSSNPTADTKPISFGQIEPCSNDADAAAPITAPTIRLNRIPLASTIKAKLIKLCERQSINKEQNLLIRCLDDTPFVIARSEIPRLCAEQAPQSRWSWWVVEAVTPQLAGARNDKEDYYPLSQSQKYKNIAALSELTN